MKDFFDGKLDEHSTASTHCFKYSLGNGLKKNREKMKFMVLIGLSDGS